jgi:glycosyltransferase involved in cell wall biosynthesis
MSGSDVRVSVVVCTYNGEKYLRDQLQSILDQTRPPDEIIISDDGSTDSTLEIIEEFASSSGGPNHRCGEWRLARSP